MPRGGQDKKSSAWFSPTNHGALREAVIAHLRLLLLLAASGLVAQPATAQPFIFYRGILNAASFSSQGLPNSAIARGSIFSIFGHDLGPAEGAVVSSFPLADSLAGVSIEVCQAGACSAAIPLFVRADQINAVLRSDAPLGAVSVRVTFDGQAGNFSPAEVVETSFGAFAISSAGFGPGIVQNFISESEQPINSAIATARPGQTVILWGSGLGAGLNADNIAPVAGDLPVDIEIWVGGKPAAVRRYGGRSPCCSGVDQLVFDLPADAPVGCYVPIHVRVNGVLSNTVTIAISNDPAAPCADPWNPLDAARPGGRIGVILLARVHTTTPLPRLDFASDMLAAFFQDEPAGPWHFNRMYSLPPAGSCATYAFPDGELTTSLLADFAANGAVLSAAPELAIGGPGGNTTARALPDARNFYGALAGTDFGLAPLMSLIFGMSDTTRVSAVAADDVGAFAVDLAPPPRLDWTNREALTTLTRGDPLDISWTGGDPAGLVVAAAFARRRQSLSSAGFVCTEHGSANRFTVPGRITGSLPSNDQAEGFDAIALVGGLPATAQAFTASGLDAAAGLHASVEARGVDVE